MLLWKNHRHTGMDLCYELTRLTCDNRASAHPLPRFGIFPVFPEPGKGERASFMAIANGSFGLAVLRHSKNPSAGIRHRRLPNQRGKD
jgi:hypothetical protein